MLTEDKIDKLKPGKHAMGESTGLYLVVGKSGSKSWIQRLSVNGRTRNIGLGSLRWVSLEEAREVARKNQRIAREGGNPFQRKDERRAERARAKAEAARRAMPSFRELADEFVAYQADGWTTKYATQWLRDVHRHTQPIAAKSVAEITIADILDMIVAIREQHPRTGNDIRRRVRAIMALAVARGHRPDNPAGDDLTLVLPKRSMSEKQMASVAWPDAPRALRAIRDHEGSSETCRLCLAFVAHTVVRSQSARGARWSEIDERAATWTVPADRMKTKQEFRVPLSSHALELAREGIAASRLHAPETDLLFLSPASRTGGTWTSTALSDLQRTAWGRGVPHGWRATFRTWASEQTDADHAVMELSLSHAVGSRVEQAYARSDLFSRRRTLMQQWSDYLAA